MKTLLGCLTLLLVGAVTAQITPQSLPALVDALKADGHFNVFLDLLENSDILDRINTSTHFTVFAPTDAAFAKLPAGTLDALKADQNKLEDILDYHVVLNTAFHGNQQDQNLKTANNGTVRINSYPLVHVVSVDGVNITIRNLHVAGGYVQGIDTILTPPVGNIVDIGTTKPEISTFESLIAKANLTNFFTSDHSTTIFAPNNDAFTKLSQQTLDYLNSHPADLAEVLKFHLVKQLSLYSIGMKHSLTVPTSDQHKDNLMILEDGSGGLKVNHANIVERDIGSVNGVVHVIDNVLIPVRVQVAIADSGIVIG